MNARSSKQRSQPDGKRVLPMRDDEIDFSDNPPFDESFFRTAS